MAVRWTGRAGLGLRMDGGGVVGSDDLNQVADTLGATRTALGHVLGGPGIYAGGAASYADLASGASYPAVAVVLADAAGYLWAFRTVSPTPIVYSLASGAARLYAAPTLIADVVPPAADGRVDRVRFICQPEGDPAPAGGLLLGSGTVAAGRLTNYTPDPGARPGTAALTVSTGPHASSHQHDGPDEIATATPAAHAIPKALSSGQLDLGWVPLASEAAAGAVRLAASGVTDAGRAVQGSDTRLAAALAALPASGGDMTGVLGLIAGGLRLPRWPHFGPPAAGSADLLGFDRAGALWLHDGAGWRQLTAGTPLSWSGGGADDVTAAANWVDGILDGYRAYESAYGGEWQRHGGLGRWSGREQQLSVTAGFLSFTDTAFLVHMPTNRESDMMVRRAGLIYRLNEGTLDAANFWDMSIQASGGTVLLADTPTTTGTTYLDEPVADIVLATTTVVQVNVRAVKTGSPTNGTVFGARINYRELRK